MNYLKSIFLSITLLLAATISPLIAAPCNTCSSNNSCESSSSCTTHYCSESSSCQSLCSNPCDSCHSVYITRPTYNNSAYKWLYLAHDSLAEECYNIFDIGFEYQRSFSGKDIAQCLFGDSTLRFQGSQVTNRASNSLIADYFGLSTQSDVSVALNPRIENFNLHFMSYFAFDRWCKGLYGAVNFTLTRQKRTLITDNCSLCPLTDNIPSQTAFPAGYMGINEITPLSSLKQALAGQVAFGNMRTPWQFGIFNFDCDQSLTRIAGVDVIAGYDFLHRECGEFGIFAIYTAPTGNKNDATYVFSPLVGNGKHHELGGGIHARYKAWQSDKNDNEFISLYLDGYVSHLFNNCQVRSFDFKNAGCMSRYMLLKELTPSSLITTTSGIVDNLINAINWTTRYAEVNVAVKGDATLRMVYTNGGFHLNLGYNLYGQSKEKVCIKGFTSCNRDLADRQFGFKGCSGTTAFRYNFNTGTDLITGAATPATQVLNTTQSDATIRSCGADDNAVALLDTTAGTIGVAWNNTGAANAIAIGTDINALSVANISEPALIVSTTDLDPSSGAAPRQLTSKGFIDLNYTWLDCNECCVTPYVGFGLEIEGGSRDCDLKEWGVWLRGGLEF